jgi:hypothetical protein
VIHSFTPFTDLKLQLDHESQAGRRKKLEARNRELKKLLVGSLLKKRVLKIANSKK